MNEHELQARKWLDLLANAFAKAVTHELLAAGHTPTGPELAAVKRCWAKEGPAFVRQTVEWVRSGNATRRPA